MSISSGSLPGRSKARNRKSRRDFINETLGGVAFLSASGKAILTNDRELSLSGKTADRKLKIVVTGGHPGDPEYGCGGTIATYADSGHEVVLLYLNRGEAGIEGASAAEAARVRTREALRACEILNARAVFANQVDGQSIVDVSRYNELYELLADEQPDIIFTQWPLDNHPDHRAISSLVYDSWLRLRKLKSSAQPLLYFYEVSNGEDTLMFSPSYYVDISEMELRKQKACLAHESQAPEKFYPLQEQVSKFRGLECGCKMAEAFLPHIWSGPGLLLKSAPPSVR
jgi:N-acetylglucosamine malate deacetylase 1